MTTPDRSLPSTSMPLLAQRLNRRLSRWPERLRKACCSGDCDAFALALHGWLQAQHIPATIEVGARVELDAQGLAVTENSLSHVVVRALGTHWDVQGPAATDAWERQWSPPSPTSRAGHRFTWAPTDEAALRALRRHRDQREVHEERLAECAQHLGKPWPLLLTETLRTSRAHGVDLLTASASVPSVRASRRR